MDSPDKFDYPVAPKTDAERAEEWKRRYCDRRRVIEEWHGRAVSMGFDGVASALDHLRDSKATVTKLRDGVPPGLAHSAGEKP